ncbi:hypothetical protein DFQ26_000733 [Actinomortierella ambigua]|nr:hypothetical protein DFQ26_000733 [Actinomortierella ambigua]
MDSNVVPVELKDPCSSILSTPSIGASNARSVADHLAQIHSVLQHIPSPAEQHFPEPLVKYVVFALFHVFRLLNRFTRPSTRFDFLVEPWLACLQDLLVLPHAYTITVGRSMDDARIVLEALLIMIDGLPIVDDSTRSSPKREDDPRKRKKDRMADDIRLQAVRCLIAFFPLPASNEATTITAATAGVVAPGIESDETSDESMDITEEDTTTTKTTTLSLATRPYPSPTDHLIRQQLLNPEDPRSEAIIGQTIVILLDTGTGTTSVPLRVAGMEAIDRLLNCLGTPSALARWMPGVFAGVTSTMLEKGLMDHHSVPVKALQVMSYLITTVMQGTDGLDGDESPSSQGKTREINADNIRKMMESQAAAASTTRNNSTNSSNNVGNDPPKYGTVAWLQKTQSALRVVFQRIAGLRAHTHWRVRRQFGEFSFSLLQHCHASMGENAQFLLETLIGCSQDTFSDVVAQPARAHLFTLSTLSPGHLELENVAIQVLRSKLLALPRLLHGGGGGGLDEAAKQWAIKTLSGLVLFLGPRVQILIQQQLWETVQPWRTLLAIDRLEDKHHATVATDRQGVLAAVLNEKEQQQQQQHVSVSKAIKEHRRWKAWVQHLSPQNTHRGGSSGELNFGFPRRNYLFLHEQATAEAFQAFLRQLGFSTDIAMWYGELLTGLQQQQGDVEGEALDASTPVSIDLLNQLLLGAAGVGVRHLGEAMLTAEAVLNQDEEQQHQQKDKARKQQQSKQRRHVRRVARDILGDYLEMLSRLDFATETIRQPQQQQPPPPSMSETMAMAHKRGLDGVPKPMTTTAAAAVMGNKVHVQVACLLLEGIATIAVVIGQDFETELIRVLYLLLELLSDPDSEQVRASAEAALNHVAFATGYESIGEMLSENYDYVVQQVSQRIAFISRNPKTPQVLISLIRVVGPRAVAMLEDSVTEIMIALDMQVEESSSTTVAGRVSGGEQASEGLLKALFEITRAMALERSSSPPPPQSSSSAEETRRREKNNMGVTPSRLEDASTDVLRFAKQYQALARIADRDREEKELSKQKKMTPTEIRQYFMDRAAAAKKEKEELMGASEDEGEEEEEEEEGLSGKSPNQHSKPPTTETTPPTKHEALCLRIFHKAGYFLSSSSPRMRVLALEIIKASIPVLRQRPNEFYPAIHDLWGSIMARLRLDPEFFVSLRAIEVITALADHCSDFLKKKLLDDVWPFILQAMRTWTRKVVAKTLPSSSSSSPKPSASAAAYSMFSTPSTNNRQAKKTGATTTGKLFTREHRLQMTTLQSLSKIVRVVQAPVKDIWEVVVLTCEFLDEFRFHVDVQEASVQLIKDLARQHGDPVWLALTETLERDERRVRRFGEGEGGKIGHCIKLLRYLEEQQL